jgi:putative hydrolase of the HAD superfamily
MIKALIFDLGGVIVPFDFKRSYSALAELCSCPAEEIPKRIGATDLVTRFETGQIESKPFVEKVSALLDLRIGYDEFCQIFSSIFAAETLIPDWFLERLRRNYTLLLLSNTNAIHFDMLSAAYPILRHFDHLVLSYRQGAMKPSPLIFQRAVELANCEPEECFFTDDISSYVEAARRLGIAAVQFRSFEELQVELTNRGISW